MKYTEADLTAAMGEVWAALDMPTMQLRCQQSKKTLFHALGGKQFGPKHDRHAFKHNDAKILMVAHLDTVQQDNTFGSIRYSDETLIFCPRLDDRLGAYTILDLMPRLGVQADLLFTDNEERGQTTAKNFRTAKKYNWIASFDRRGDDVVTYQFTWDSVLRDYFRVGHGSFSCIAELDELGCQAVNVGVGYANEHSKYAYFRLEEYVEQMARFLLFYRQYSKVRFTYENRAKYHRGYGGGWGRHQQSASKALADMAAERAAERKAEPAKPDTPPIEKSYAKSKLELMLNEPLALAFCDVCWECKLANGLNWLGDTIACRKCGTLLEIDMTNIDRK